MPTYDLDQTQLTDFLNGQFLNSTPLSNATQQTIDDALFNAGLYPSQLPGGTLLSDYQNDSGKIGVGVDLNTVSPSGPTQFFLELGSNTAIDINGSSGAVIATGDGANIYMNDVAGDDTLVGGAGHDTLVGGFGSYLIGGSGAQDLVGEGGDDTLQAGSGDDTLTVRHGNNTLVGGSGPSHDTIQAGTGHDTIYGGTGADSILMDPSGTGHTKIYTGAGHDTIHAEVGHDTIYVGYADSYNSGSGGSDTIYAGGTANTQIDINDASYTKVITGTAADGNQVIIFNNGSATTHVEISGHATIDFKHGGSTTV